MYRDWGNLGSVLPFNKDKLLVSMDVGTQFTNNKWTNKFSRHSMLPIKSVSKISTRLSLSMFSTVRYSMQILHVPVANDL